MTTIIVAVITAVLGFVGGILVGRKNVKTVNTAVTTTNAVASAATTAVDAVKKAV